MNAASVRQIAAILAPKLLGVAAVIAVVMGIGASNVFGPFGVAIVGCGGLVGLAIAFRVILAIPQRLTATTEGMQIGSGSVVPWAEIAEIRVDDGGDRQLIAASQLPPPATRTDGVVAKIYPDHRLVPSAKPAIYVSFAHWWTRYRLPLRFAFLNPQLRAVPTQPAAGGTGWSALLAMRGSTIHLIVLVDSDLAGVRDLAAQLAELRTRANAVPLARVA